MFSKLQTSLDRVFKNLTGKGVISENDINATAREIRIALLEADVSLSVVKEFTNRIKEKALGEKIVKSVSPGQMIVKIVQDEIEALLAPTNEAESELNFKSAPPNIFMMIGLQGSGKTTSTAKIANKLKKETSKKILLASLDAHRPAAKEQLAQLAKNCQIDSLSIMSEEKPLDTAKRAKKEAELGGYDILFLDTAGRLHVDDELMQELQEIQKLTKPIETLLTLDSLTGGDAVKIAENFNQKLQITGIILTRIDGDGRGGAALSMKSVINKPIKFIGVGEKIEDLQKFDAKRMASRILGMGDITSLVEKAVAEIDEAEAKKMQSRMQKGQFDLNDMQSQFRNIKKMGGFGGIMNLLPGMSKIQNQIESAKEKGAFSEDILKKYDAIISSMTKKERKFPKILNGSRKKRIALGSGTQVQDVNILLKQHEQMHKVMKKFSQMDKKSLMRAGANSLLNMFK